MHINLKRRHKNTIKFKKTLLSFDDYPFPITNKLYIHLFNNQYYNENIYNKKKIDIEREMLFLLAGKLGVKTINYEIVIKNIIFIILFIHFFHKTYLSFYFTTIFSIF